MDVGSERPSGTVTFLFSDIEGSTRLLQRLGALYAGALAEHQRLLREAFAAHGGHEIDTQGDSFFVAFRRAKDAVAAAVDAQRALAEYDWPEGAELRVRIGIHTGEPVAGEERYVGLGVHRAARIGASAVGGQVLVSESTRALLRDDPLPDVALRDLGLHRLKDIDEPERLFELDAPGLVHADLAGPAGRVSRRRLVVGAALVTVALAAALGALLSHGGGTAKASSVAPNEVGVLDARDGSISGAVPVGSAPNGVAVGDDAVWVANTDADTVSRINMGSNSVNQTIEVGGSPVGVAVSPGSVWVANASDGTVSRIDPSTNTVVQPIPVGNGPEGIAYAAGKVWVANSADGTVTEIDARSYRVEETLPCAVGITDLTVLSGHVWAVSPASGSVVELGPSGCTTSVGVGVDPDALAAAAGAIWVANRQDGTVSKIDPRTASVTEVIPVGHEPDAIVGNSAGVWVANAGDATLWKIDPAANKVVKTVPLANPPQGLTLTGTDLYVSVRSNGLAHRGGTLRVEVGQGGTDSVDPAYGSSLAGWAILSLTNDGLVGFRRVGGAEGTQLVPDLATSLPVPTDHGRTYTFTLRSGIRYSNGRLVEPEDIKAAIERTLAAKPATPLASFYTGDILGASRCSAGKPCDLSKGIVTNQLARTITFHLVAPNPDFLLKLAIPNAYAIPPGTADRDVSIVPATGPYMVAAFRPKQRLVRLVRNPRFHEWSRDAQPAGFPASIEIAWPRQESPAATAASLRRAVEGGKSDLAAFALSPPLPKQTLDDLATRYPSQLHLDLEPVTFFFFLNTHVAPFDDVRVRQAVQEAFDRSAFGQLLGREYSPTCNILPPGYAGYGHGCPYRGSETARLSRAKQLVRASGTAGARIVVWTPTPLAFEGRFMARFLDSLGFRARTHTVSSIDTYFGTIFDPRRRVQTGYLGWLSNYPSSSDFFSEQFSCAARYVSEFCDRHIDAELRHAAQVEVLDPAAATLLWQKLERQLFALAPMIPTYNGRAVSFVSKRVGNFQYNPQWGVLLDQLWVK